MYSQINVGLWIKPEGTWDQLCKESSVRYPGASGFCYWASEFFLRYSNYRRTMKSILPIQMFLGLVEMMFGVIHASFSLPAWQALKMTFFAPWGLYKALMLSGIFHFFLISIMDYVIIILLLFFIKNDIPKQTGF